MKRMLRAGVLCLGILGLAGMTDAGTIVLFPDSPGVSGVVGNTSPGAPLPTGSFQANATPSSGNKSEIYVDAASLFGGQKFTIGQIASMSYFTNKSGPATAPDWTLILYTDPTSSGNTASWYHARLNAEPYFTNSTVTPGTWHQWSTGGSNPLTFYDQARSGNFGTYTDPTLTGIQNGTYSWANDNYADQTVKYISFQTGSAWATGFDGLLDAFNISLTTTNEVGVINFEAVPVPSSVWAGLVLFAGLAAFKLRRKPSIA